MSAITMHYDVSENCCHNCARYLKVIVTTTFVLEIVVTTIFISENSRDNYFDFPEDCGDCTHSWKLLSQREQGPMSRVLDPACGPGPMNRAHELWPGTRPGMVQVPGTPEFPMSPPQQMRPGKTDTSQASPQIDDTRFHFENSCQPICADPVWASPNTGICIYSRGDAFQQPSVRAPGSLAQEGD